MEHQNNKCKLGYSFLNQMTSVVIISCTLFLYMPGSVSGLPICFWMIAWTNSLNRNCHCVCSIQEFSCLGCLSWFLLRFWFIEMLSGIWGQANVFKNLSIITMYLGHGNMLKHNYLPLWVDVSKFILSEKSLFFSFYNVTYRT